MADFYRSVLQPSSHRRELTPLVKTILHEQQSYEVLEKLGQGAYGVVYKAYDHRFNQFVAIKTQDIQRNSIRPNIVRELVILAKLSHPNIVNKLDQFTVGNTLYLVMEYGGSSLSFFLKHQRDVRQQAIPPYQVKSVIKEILLAVAYMHKKHIIHRDLKPDNILYTMSAEGLSIKVADFGLSAEVMLSHTPLSSQVQTLLYRAPELLNSYGLLEYDYSIDIWSVGCIFAEMLLSRHLFQVRDQRDLLECIRRTMNNQDILNELRARVGDDSGFELLTSMLQIQPHHRITALKALDHDYFHS